MENLEYKLGAKILTQGGLAKILPEYEEIFETINSRRERFVTKSNCKLNLKSHDNVISILGERGSGKTSVLMTLSSMLKKIKNSEDIVLQLIEPEVLESSDLIGWIIANFKKHVDKCNEIWEKLSLCDKRKYLNERKNVANSFCTSENQDNPVKLKFEMLCSMYSKKSKVYDEIILKEYLNKKKLNQDIIEKLKADICLVEKFQEFIEELVKFKSTFGSNCNYEVSDCFYNYKNTVNKEECRYEIKEIEKNYRNLNSEMTIYFFFDDMDLFQGNTLELFKCILHFLSIPNIIIFVGGDYQKFNEKLTIEYLKEDDLLAKDLMEISFSENNDLNSHVMKKRLASDFIKKILSPNNRYYLKEYKVNERMDFKPSEEGIRNSNENYLIDNILGKIINSDNKNKKILKKYGILLDKYPRGLMNLYQYFDSKSDLNIDRLSHLLIDSNRDFLEYKYLINENIHENGILYETIDNIKNKYRNLLAKYNFEKKEDFILFKKKFLKILLLFLFIELFSKSDENQKNKRDELLKIVIYILNSDITGMKSIYLVPDLPELKEEKILDWCHNFIDTDDISMLGDGNFEKQFKLITGDLLHSFQDIINKADILLNGKFDFEWFQRMIENRNEWIRRYGRFAKVNDELSGYVTSIIEKFENKKELEIKIKDRIKIDDFKYEILESNIEKSIKYVISKLYNCKNHKSITVKNTDKETFLEYIYNILELRKKVFLGNFDEYEIFEKNFNLDREFFSISKDDENIEETYTYRMIYQKVELKLKKRINKFITEKTEDEGSLIIKIDKEIEKYNDENIQIIQRLTKQEISDKMFVFERIINLLDCIYQCLNELIYILDIFEIGKLKIGYENLKQDKIEIDEVKVVYENLKQNQNTIYNRIYSREDFDLESEHKESFYSTSIDLISKIIEKNGILNMLENHLNSIRNQFSNTWIEKVYMIIKEIELLISEIKITNSGLERMRDLEFEGYHRILKNKKKQRMLRLYREYIESYRITKDNRKELLQEILKLKQSMYYEPDLNKEDIRDRLFNMVYKIEEDKEIGDWDYIGIVTEFEYLRKEYVKLSIGDIPKGLEANPKESIEDKFKREVLEVS